MIEIGYEHALRTFVLDNEMRPRQTPILLIFTHLHNEDSIRFAGEIHKLAQLTKDKPRVVRADCLFDLEACDLFKTHLKEFKDKWPLVVMITHKKSHVYEGELLADKIFEDFVKHFKF